MTASFASPVRSPSGNFHDDLLARAPAPDTVVIRTPEGDTLTWGALERRAAQAANLLRAAGLTPGERVAIQTPKTLLGVALYLGCLRAGLVTVPLNTAYQAAELEHFLADSAPRAFIYDPERATLLEPLARQHGVQALWSLGQGGAGSLRPALDAQPDTCPTRPCRPEDLAVILYTSGTTGRSKGAMLTHANLAANAHTLHDAWHWSPADVLLHALPVFHIHGLFVALHGALIAGATLEWHERFDAVCVADRLPGCTVFMGVPTMYVRLLDEPRFTPAAAAGVRLFVSGSAPLMQSTFDAFAARTGQHILERYGMSETVMLTSNPYAGPRRSGTVGLPLPGVALRIAPLTTDAAATEDGPADEASTEVGGIEVRGPSIFAGYWNLPERTAAEFTPDGWFRTGDLGSLDAEGYVRIIGRSKDLVISGGYNVYPKEVEAELDRCPGVRESAVFGVPHPEWGEAVTGAVVAEPGATPDLPALVAHLRTRLAAFKVPRTLHLVEELPRNTMGKVQKAALRARFGAS